MNPKTKVLATIIGSFKNKDASFAYDKTTKLIQAAAPFVTKDNKTTTQGMARCQWLILGTKDEKMAKQLVDACLVINKLKVVVLFREIIRTYSPVHSLTICHLVGKFLY